MQVLVTHRRKKVGDTLGERRHLGEAHGLGANAACRGNQHQDEGLGIHIHRVKSLDGCAGCAGLDGECRIVGQVGCNLGGRQKDVIQLGHLDLEKLVDLVDLPRRHSIMLDEGIYVKSVAALAGHAPCRGVRLLEVTHGLQLCHLVADGCGGAGDLPTFHEIFGANGLTVCDMRVDDRLQNLFFAITQILVSGVHVLTSLVVELALFAFKC